MFARHDRVRRRYRRPAGRAACAGALRSGARAGGCEREALRGGRAGPFPASWDCTPRGRPLRVDTADRVLAFMGYPPLGPLLRAEVEAFLAVSGTKVSILGEETVGNPSFVGRQRPGAPRRISRPSTGCAPGWRLNATREEIRAIRERLRGLARPVRRDVGRPPWEPGAAGDADELAEVNHLDTREGGRLARASRPRRWSATA